MAKAPTAAANPRRVPLRESMAAASAGSGVEAGESMGDRSVAAGRAFSQIAAIPDAGPAAARQTCHMEMKSGHGRLEREWRTMGCMVKIHCTGHQHARSAGRDVCHDCEAFLAYAARRLEKCPYGEEKPTCATCPIHCYKTQPRALAREIMRYAGPRMLWRHPLLSVRHVLDKMRHVEHPMALRRRGGEATRAPSSRDG